MNTANPLISGNVSIALRVLRKRLDFEGSVDGTGPGEEAAESTGDG